MNHRFLLAGLGSLLCAAGQAQTTQPVLPPGQIAVFKAGTPDNVFNISSSKVQPCFVQAFDTQATNQAAPLISIALSTNSSVPGSVWINAHAGSEGGGISRSVDRQFLALEGYTGNILSPTNAKPSSAIGVTRGIVRLDAFNNAISVYSDPANWFGLPPGVSQNNPTGIATTDGTNYWGTGNVTGTSGEASGTLFYNASVGATPFEIQNYIQAAAQARIIGGVLYVVVPGGGVYNFLATPSAPPPFTPGQVIPLPYDPNVANPYQTTAQTNLFLAWGSTFKNIANFDMNPSATLAYGADETYGIVKFTNNAGTWVQAPYYFNSTNLGTFQQPAAQQGCFGICVDFSGTNPVIYATTMEAGALTTGNKQGNANANRLLRIVDTGLAPGTNLVAITLATATTTNEAFRGIDFTPDLRPLITTNPVSVSTTNNGSASFWVGASSAYPLTYQWTQNGTNLAQATTTSLSFPGVQTNLNGYSYQCVVSNVYGVVTSTPASLTVTFVAVRPSITNQPAYLTNYAGATQILGPISPRGTEPFTYQWYQGSTALVDDGVNIFGSTNASLTLSNLTVSESGPYSLVVANSAGTASNLVDWLTVIYQLPVINPGGEPVSATTFVGGTVALVVAPTGGSQPQNIQWYGTSGSLTDGGDFSGTGTGTLTITPAALGDAGAYYAVVSSPGGSVTSVVAQVTVLVPPPYSFVNYTNQVYLQDFDSLPDPGSNSVNSINNPLNPGNINGVYYSLANPFDFAFPVINNNYVGGLGLAATMSGWYGAADTLPDVTTPSGIVRFGAQDGDQTTGGVIDFGPNDGAAGPGSNRALGLLSTSTTGATTFALKLVNGTAIPLNYVDLSFVGELWHQGTGARTLSFGYVMDPTASSFTLTSESITNAVAVPDLDFSFPTAVAVAAVDGTSAAYQTNLSVANLPLSAPWQPGTALWLIWAINYYGAGSGNGYAIDNLRFQATANVVVTQPASPFTIGRISLAPGAGATLSFTNTPGLSFTVLSTTNVALPLGQWRAAGPAVEGAPGSYTFTDPASLTNSQIFYTIRHP